jgi:hypothetical protein
MPPITLMFLFIYCEALKITVFRHVTPFILCKLTDVSEVLTAPTNTAIAQMIEVVLYL